MNIDQQLLEDCLRRIVYAAHNAFMNSLNGAAYSERCREYCDRVRNPQVGDMVYEESVVYARTKDRFFAGVGKLLKIQSESVRTAEQIAADGYDPKDTFWYIEGIDGQERRWSNCSFVAIPDCLHFGEARAANIKDETGTEPVQ